jgi:cell division protein FtsQ
VQSLGRDSRQRSHRGSRDLLRERAIAVPASRGIFGLSLPRLRRSEGGSKRLARGAQLLGGNRGWRGLVVLCLAAGGGYGLWTSGKSEGLYLEAKAGVERLAVAIGFGVKQIVVEGQDRLGDAEVAKALGAGPGSMILAFDTDAAKARLEAVPWVKQARIMRLLPSTLRVLVEERTPYALWQSKGETHVVDAEGAVLAPATREAYPALPLVVGDGAGKSAADLMRVLAPFEPVRRQLVAAIRVGDRRWTLKLASGIDVMLPEDGIEDALKTLVTFDNERDLLRRGVAAVDLRLGDRIGVRLREQAAPITAPDAPVGTNVPLASSSGKT